MVLLVSAKEYFLPCPHAFLSQTYYLIGEVEFDHYQVLGRNYNDGRVSIINARTQVFLLETLLHGRVEKNIICKAVGH